jgi:hypothetical protein
MSYSNTTTWFIVSTKFGTRSRSLTRSLATGRMRTAIYTIGSGVRALFGFE